jgi:hypothetical protein
MLQSLENLHGFKLHEKDGDMGHVVDFYFDDRKWAIRYLVADYGNWVLGHEKVLVRPRHLGHPDWTEQKLSLKLTMDQVTDCPSSNTHIPISRQHHAHKIFTPTSSEYADAYEEMEAIDMSNPEDAHLYSFSDTKGFHLHAKDGDIGHLLDLMVNEENWEVVWAVVSTHNWWLGKDVLIPPNKINLIDVGEKKVYVDMTKQEIKDSPT